MKKFFIAPLLILSMFSFTGCTEMIVGSHYFKKATNKPAAYKAPRITGKRKIGNPYEIMGKTYYPIPSSEGYRAKGIASWYGKDFHGKPTANGERYNMYDLTAAHPTLPLPTYVRVTNLKNGKSLVVRVNDRGPFLRGRLIDLSYRSAVALDMAEDGTAPVLLEALPTDGSTLKTKRYASASHIKQKQAAKIEDATSYSLTRGSQAEIQLPPAQKAKSLGRIETPSIASPESVADGEDIRIGSSQIFVQTGAFSDFGNARTEKLRVREHFENVKVVPVTINGRILHRVRIGPIANVNSADQILARLMNNGFNVAQIVVE